MSIHTDNITIGRDPFLTLFIIRSVAARKDRDDKRKAFIRKLTFWKK